ncbi:unnamed protein product, partial [marine sediment metagenome]
SSSYLHTTLRYWLEGKFPETGRIVVTLHQGMTKWRVPFKVTDISLIGRPIGKRP